MTDDEKMVIEDKCTVTFTVVGTGRKMHYTFSSEFVLKHLGLAGCTTTTTSKSSRRDG